MVCIGGGASTLPQDGVLCAILCLRSTDNTNSTTHSSIVTIVYISIL